MDIKQPRYKCLLCGRDKFTKPHQPHYCAGGYRKHGIKSIKIETMENEITEMQKLQWENKALREALQYLVDTKDRKDTIGKDSIYMQRKSFGWIKAKRLLLKQEDK